MSRTSNHTDAIVVGGNIAGLTVAYFLSQFGYRTRLIERAPFLGGTDASFTIESGARFDCGLHALDSMRSELVTKLFLHVIDHEVRKVRRSRGIVLRNQMIPYNAPPEDWPAEFQEMFPDGEWRDQIGASSPTRANMAKYYGQEFADFIYDEVLESYPSETRHLKFGVKEHELMANIYPWFFPYVPRAKNEANRSRTYHDKMRKSDDEWVVYPSEGGFGRFAEKFAEKIEAAGASIVKGIKELETVIDPETKGVSCIRADGEEYTADRVFWCGPAPILADLLGMEPIDTKPDLFMLGSLHFDRPLNCPYHELILGDPEHLIKRASLPGELSGSGEPLIQLEFSFPKTEPLYSTDPEFWKASWLKSLVKLGITTEEHSLVGFDLKSFPILYNCFGVEGQPMPEFDFSWLPEESNLLPVLPSIRNININTRVPQFLKFIVDELAGPNAWAAPSALGVLKASK